MAPAAGKERATHEVDENQRGDRTAQQRHLCRSWDIMQKEKAAMDELKKEAKFNPKMVMNSDSSPKDDDVMNFFIINFDQFLVKF